MWKLLKKIFTPRRQPKKENLDFSKMSKGDLKKLKEQGVIKSIYKPYY